MQTDYLDLLQIHCGPEEVETIRRGEALEGMLRAKKEGKVRWIGVSCGASGAHAALEMNAYDVLQLPYSLLNRSIEKGLGEGQSGDDSILARAAKANVGVIIREALEHGKLTDKFVEPRRTATLFSPSCKHGSRKLNRRAPQYVSADLPFSSSCGTLRWPRF